MRARRAGPALAGLLLLLALWLTGSNPASAQPTPPPAPTAPTQTPPATDGTGTDTSSDGTNSDGRVELDLDLGGLAGEGEDGKPSQSIVVLLGLTVLAVAPSLVVMMTSFTRMIVTLSIARNAVGMATIPPNQVITGLALFLSLFVMAPVIKDVNDQAWQPYLDGTITQSQALKAAEAPIKGFMLENTRKEELNLMVSLSGQERPEEPEDLSLFTVIPAFALSELKAAFIIGVVVLLPFLVIDLVVSAGLMSLGMMMVPPVFVSLPFKLLLFVMADGWALIAEALVANYR